VEPIPWNNAKTSNLRESNQLVGGRSEEMETDRSMIEYKPATRAPQSHRVLNQVEASVEGGNDLDWGGESIETEAPIDVQMRKRRVRFAEEQNQEAKP
jgi:hypothetical protein